MRKERNEHKILAEKHLEKQTLRRHDNRGTLKLN
jgi:hypothetical protein